MPSILVVDDSSSERVRVSGLLAMEDDFELHEAASGDEAMQQLDETAIDLVVTDLQMPGIDGLQLVRRVVRDYPHVPVVLMTAVGSEIIAGEALHEGAASYVPKGDLAQLLVEAVTTVLDSRADEYAGADVLRHLVQDEYELELENDPNLMSAAARFLCRTVQAARICEPVKIVRIGVALEEALLNACFHGNLELDSRIREESATAFYELARKRADMSPWKDRRVRVQASISPEEARIAIKDEGAGFDPSALPDPGDPENLLKPHGRGVMMMQMFLDEVSWNDRGDQVTLIKRR